MKSRQTSASCIALWVTASSLASLASGCATGVILSPRPSPKWFQSIPFFPQAKESAEIPTETGVSLLYDRNDIVLYEDPESDGQTYANYAVVVRNSNAFLVQLLAREIAIIAENVPTLVPLSEVPENQRTSQILSESLKLSQAAEEKTEEKSEDKTEAKSDEKSEDKKDAAPPAAPEKPKEPPKQVILKNHRFPAIYRKEDRITPQIPVAGKSYFRLPVSFRIDGETLKFYGNSELSVTLTVSLSNGKALKLPLWIWRRK